jgi:hypothetical protein
MATKFAEFIESNKIDPRRLIIASRQIERLQPDDRRLRLSRKQSKGSEQPKKPAAADGADQAAPAKPRSGRPVTRPLLDKVAAGKPVPGAAKTRLLRAVNRILEQKKSDPVDIRALF